MRSLVQSEAVESAFQAKCMEDFDSGKARWVPVGDRCVRALPRAPLRVSVSGGPDVPYVLTPRFPVNEGWRLEKDDRGNDVWKLKVRPVDDLSASGINYATGSRCRGGSYASLRWRHV